ncbi:hypothetical protein ACIOHE_07505 [Streptomyces sp. NPDC087851]|uniref:hypothetical protein n=1 Tax=Streptomyces sp. NPDC087851 TaxID=3365810 RepID=UPI0037FFF402
MSGIAQQGAEIRRRRVVELRDGHDVVSRADDQGAEIHRTDDVVHHPRSGLVQDTPGQFPAPGQKVTTKTPRHIHAHQPVQSSQR